ncbi:MAG TPA: TetR/AcrR family transcriptional regulator [Polyangiaceae bacterium]|jgi:AcrR family transcriptional regulator|nr:TetR/AcrR family transcriptional regulator [Polyangiaceae bacterium]
MARPSDPNARQRLLDAARHEFVSRGLDRTRVEDIARRAELSKGAFYLHFESKEQIFDELVFEVASGLEQMLDQTGHCFSVPVESPEHLLRRCFTQDLGIFEFIRDNRGMMALMLEGGGSGRHRHLIESFAARTERVVSAGLRAGMAAGYYRDDLEVDSAAAFIAGGYDRFARNLIKMLLAEGAECDLASHLAKVIRQVIAGVGSSTLAAAARCVLPGLAQQTKSATTGAPIEAPTASGSEPSATTISVSSESRDSTIHPRPTSQA